MDSLSRKFDNSSIYFGIEQTLRWNGHWYIFCKDQHVGKKQNR